MIEAFKDEYRWLSNFWLEPVPMNGLVYPSVENAYQAAKVDPEDRMDFVFVTPGVSKKLGQMVDLPENWDTEKLTVMKHLINAKFRRGSFLAEKLIATGDQDIIEGNTWNDTYWGICNGVGRNHLGKILMTVRMKRQHKCLHQL